MNPFSENDTVRVHSQPDGWTTLIQGEVGIVLEVQGDDECRIQCFRNNDYSGDGVVPISCLESFSSPELTQAINTAQARILKMFDEMHARGKRWRTLVALTARDYNIPETDAEQVLNRGRQWSRTEERT